MKRYKKYLKICEAVGVALSVYISTLLLQAIQSKSKIILLLIILFIVIVITKLIEYFFNELYDRFAPVRSFIHGPNYIEGTWLDYAKYNFGIISISYNNEDISIQGVAQNHDSGELMYTWESKFCQYDGNNLKYIYDTIELAEGNDCKQELGFSKIEFHRPKTRSKPNCFTGRFFNFNEKNGIHLIRGIRLTDNDSEKIRKNIRYAENFLDQITIQSQFNTDDNKCK